MTVTSSAGNGGLLLGGGIDRDAINESFMLGTGSPSATVPISASRYFAGPEWVRRWATLDVAQANRLLDELGLSRKDFAGFRQRQDGGGRLRLVCQSYPEHFDYPAVAEMIADQWRAIGIELNVQIVTTSLWTQRCLAGAVQLAITAADSEDPITYPQKLFPFSTEAADSLTGIEFARWFQSGGSAGRRPPDDIVAIMELWRRARGAPTEQRLEIGREILRRHVDLVLTIGLISGGLSSYGIRVAKTSLGNVPRRVINSLALRAPVDCLPMTLYYR